MERQFDDSYFDALDKELSFIVPKEAKRAVNAGEFVCIDRKRSEDDIVGRFWQICGGEMIYAKEAFFLVKSGEMRLHFVDWTHEFPETVRAFWAFEDAFALPYYKDWRELIVAHRNETKPLEYTAQTLLPSLNYKATGLYDQSYAYRVANALLALEENPAVLSAQFRTQKRVAFVCKNYRIPVPKAAQKLPESAE